MKIIINVICLPIIPAKYNDKHWPVTCKLLLTASISKMCKPTTNLPLHCLHLFHECKQMDNLVLDKNCFLFV